MRELRFRAWSESSKKMLHDIGLHPFISLNHTKEDEDSCVYVTPGTGKGEYTLFANGGSLPIMQYTGMKDKNGVEIWEGDIVEAIFNIHGKESSIRFNAKIIYNNNIGSFQISYPNSDNHYVSDTMYARYFLKVIGNVYETPELL